MNDPIKEFVERNRAAFDELEAPPFDLEGFKMKVKPVDGPKVKKLRFNNKWLAAASVLIVLGISFLLFKPQHTMHPANQTVKKMEAEQPAQENAGETLPQAKNETRFANANHLRKVIRSPIKLKSGSTLKTNAHAMLSDSSSSSNRLLAVLEIKKSGEISNALIDKLAKTLNHDDNSNVRLAALGVLEKYSSDAYVTSVLVQSLSTQNDPMVQLGLINLLGKVKDVNINDKLYALANNPDTFAAVKDEAYTILLKEDKL